jgi:hypothetical protein
MAFIGNQPAESFTSFATQEFSTSATTSYTLDHAVTNENEIALFINNVRQQPGSGKAYTATGTALTLSAATASTDTMYCVFLGRALQTVNPAGGSVGSSQVASTIITGQTAETSIATDDTVLIHDTSAGALRKMTRANFVSGIGGDNTPLFQATLSSGFSLSNATYQKIDFDVETYDPSSVYDHTTNYRFTPATAGYYFIHGQFRANFAQDAALLSIRIYKNGSNIQAANIQHDNYESVAVSAIDLADSNDYYEIYGYQNTGGAKDLLSAEDCRFFAFKLIS